MISRMAISDIEAMRASGLNPTPAHIIRLNAFGCRAERHTQCADDACLPRAAVLGDVVLREPTVGSEIWLKSVMRFVNCETAEGFMQMRVYSLAVPQNELPAEIVPADISARVDSVFRRLAGFTHAQIGAALDYVIDGNVATDGEREPRPRDRDDGTADDDDGDPETKSWACAALYDGIAVGIGTAAEVRDMTLSQVLRTTRARMHVQTVSLLGGGARRDDGGDAVGKYYAVLDEIRHELEAEKSNGEG